MKSLKILVNLAALVVLAICTYTFLLGTEILSGEFKNEPMAWYFLPKGIFCSLSLHLSIRMLEAITKLGTK